MPHTYIVIFAIIAFATLLTWLIPSGTFERAFNESVGRTLVVPDTFKIVEHTPVSIPRMFMAIYDGMVHAADIVFFTFFSYGFMVLLIKVGAFDAGVGAMLRKLETKVHWAMPLIAIAFSLTGFAFGLWEEGLRLHTGLHGNLGRARLRPALRAHRGHRRHVDGIRPGRHQPLHGRHRAEHSGAPALLRLRLPHRLLHSFSSSSSSFRCAATAEWSRPIRRKATSTA